MADSDAPYQVGYGKPPRESRFQKGQSGNRRGRPKGSKNLATVVLRESRQFVQVNGPRGARKVTKLEAALLQVSNKAAQGDLRALREFLALVQRSEESAASGTQTISISEQDQQVMESIRRRLSSVQLASVQTRQEGSE